MHTPSDQIQHIHVIRKREDFLAIQRKQRKYVTQGMVVQVAPNHLDIIRRGITVSSKVDKRAVVRNRLKRRLRAISTDVLSQYGHTGFDIVLIGRKQGLTRHYSDLKNDLITALKKLGAADD